MEWRKSDETFFFVEGSTKFEENDDDPIKVYRVQDGDALKLVEWLIRRKIALDLVLLLNYFFQVNIAEFPPWARLCLWFQHDHNF